MDAFQIVDALVASFFGLIGIWAAVVRRHWFLRFVVVSLFLLANLLITAHEVAIEFGIQIALIMAGVWLTRPREKWEFKFSVETALLLMVVVAVVSVVLRRAGEFDWWTWWIIVTIGVGTAAYGLISLWIVFGSMKLHWRLPTALGTLLVVLAIHHFTVVLRYAVWQRTQGSDWRAAFRDKYQITNCLEWANDKGLTMLLGVSIVCTALLLGKKSQWFSLPTDESSQSSPRITKLARSGLVVLLLCVASPLLYIFYLLMNPAQLPQANIPEPNGYDDIVLVGTELDPEKIRQLKEDLRTFTRQELTDKLDEYSPLLKRVDIGLNRPHFQIRFDQFTAEQPLEDRRAVQKIGTVLLLKYQQLYRYGTITEKIAFIPTILKLNHLLSDAWEVFSPELEAYSIIEREMPQLQPAECHQLIQLLRDHGQNRKQLADILLRNRVVQENRSWITHLHLLLNTWSGEDPYPYIKYVYHSNAARCRLLQAQLAIQIFFLEHERLPNELTELLPDYLPELPLNPATKEPIEYQRLWGGYALVCKITDDRTLFAAGPASPYLWQRLQATWTEFTAWCQRFSTAPR